MSVSNAVVTGGSGGIGVETAVLLAEQGVRHIIINGRDAERGERARAHIVRRAPGASVAFVASDVSQASGADELFRQVSALIDGPLGALVNCGGGDYAPSSFTRPPRLT
jgi:2-hydroxycyclohexanecarboxyl-CoA dehydrogenase